MALACGLATLLILAIKGKIYLPKRYMLLLGYYILVIVMGVVINGTPPKQIILGIRAYLKFLPFFLLPAVYRFSDDDIKKQLRVLLFLMLLQMPIAFYQRFVEYAGVPTGDVVTGTLKTSNVLSMALLCTLAYLLVAFFDKRIGWKKFVICSLLLLLPTTINETKGTLLFLPIILAIPLFLYNKISFKTLLYLNIAFIVVIIMAFSINTANEAILSEKRHSTSIWQYISDLNIVKEYLLGSKLPREDGNIRRIRAILFAIEGISESPVSIGIGYGIGTVMDSKFKSPGEYEYYFTRGAEKMTSVQMLWEIGILGLLVNFILYLFVLKDSLFIAFKDGLNGFIGKSHFTVTVVTLLVSWIYFNTLRENIFTVIFWYLSGVVVSRAHIDKIGLVK